MGFAKSMAGVLGAALFALPATAADVTIGFPGPITGSLAFLGQHMKWGAELAAEEVNAAGGVLGGKLIVEMQDSKCSPPDSVAAVEKMIDQDKVDILMGDICSGATMAIMPIAERAKKPLVVTISTHPDITNKAGVGGNQWVFRINPTDALMGGTIANLVKKAGHKRIAYIAEDTDYGRGGVKIVRGDLGAGVEAVSEDYIEKSATEFLSVLTRIRSEKPDAILLFMLDQQLLNFMKQYVQFGLDIPLIGRPALVSGLVKDLLATGKFDGSWTIYPYFAGYDGKANVAFVDAYTKKFGQEPHYAGFEMYDGVKMIAEAIKKAGSANPDAVREALAKGEFTSILGSVKFDANHQAHNSVLLMEVKGGKLGVTGLFGT